LAVETQGTQSAEQLNAARGATQTFEAAVAASQEARRASLSRQERIRGIIIPIAFGSSGVIAILALTAVFLTHGREAAVAYTMLAFGVLMSRFVALGGLVASMLDRAFRPKRAVQIELLGTIAGIVALLGVSPAGMRFVFTVQPDTPPLWHGPLFTTTPEVVFLGLGGLVAIFNTALFASSRTFLARLTPPGQSGTFFGLYALAGTATVWLGPLAVKVAVGTFHSQQAGNVAIAILLTLGLGILSMVKE
jgi:UMF1 family MFS transporter